MAKTFTQIKAILKRHARALVEWADEGLACFDGEDMSEIRIPHNNLSHARFVKANLRGAEIRGCSFIGADFSHAKLDTVLAEGANFNQARMPNASMREADLANVNFIRANLKGADFTGAYMAGVNLRGADLRGANLTGVNLSGADLTGADLDGAILDGVRGILPVCPTEGSFIAYKKLRGDIVAKLKVPAKALRINAIGCRKCRASEAEVLELYKLREGGRLEPHDVTAYDIHTGLLEYTKGKTVKPDAFDPSRTKACTSGIHFFMTEEEARDY